MKGASLPSWGYLNFKLKLVHVIISLFKSVHEFLPLAYVLHARETAEKCGPSLT